MGCNGSKATTSKAPAKATLLDAPAEKPKELESFNIFIDGIGSSDCLVPAENLELLQVSNVVGGPIGLWNNRGNTDKVRKGEFVVKVRKASEAEWVAGDAKKMLDALSKQGPFEAEIKRNMPKPLEQQAPDEVPKGALETPPAEAPAAAPADEPAEVPERKEGALETPPAEAPAAAPADEPAAKEPEACAEAPTEAPATQATETTIAAPAEAALEAVEVCEVEDKGSCARCGFF